MMSPETRYAKSGDVSIAYQVVGSGPLDLVYVPGFVSNIELFWEMPDTAQYFSRLAAFSRLILFDKRGAGLSDRAAGVRHLEERRDDVRAVMDAAGSERAALFGVSEGGPMSLLFAATFPQRVQALILYGTYARSPLSFTSKERFQLIERAWGTGECIISTFAPNAAWDPEARRTAARWERQSASPSAAIAMLKMNAEIDVGHILPAIHVPTLIVHRIGDPAIPVACGRFLAENIANARYLELPGVNYNFLHEPEIADRLIGEVEQFPTGSRSEPYVERVLATVLFTDIVDSTGRAAELGDHQWRALLEKHNEAIRQLLQRFRGKEVKNLGDGFLATFDGPARAVRCAGAISDSVRPLGISVRSGLHTGEIVLKGDDITGIAVHIAARVAAEAWPGETVVSSTVRDLVAGSGLRFEDRGRHSLKGLPEEVHRYTVLSH